MLVTLPEEMIAQALKSALPSGPLYGRLRDEGDLAQVRGLTPDAGTLLGYWSLAGEVVSKDGIWLILAPGAEPQASLLGPAGSQQLECRVVRARADYLARARGLLPEGVLAERCVAVIGLGSGGSVIAAQLARCGVGRMRLVDFDRLEAHNIARHVCPLDDIGRYKTRALRDLLLAHSPLIQVQTWEADVLEQPAALAEAVAGADLVVAAVDSEPAKLAINRVCWAAGVPAVYAAAYNRAFGGDVFCARPPDGPCYNCLSSVIGELFAPPPTAARDFSAGYADPARMADLVAQPGLAMDVGVIALLAARVALETLLRGSADLPAPLPETWLLFGNRAEWVFREPLERHFVTVPRRADCPVCNYDQSVQSRLGMSSEEAARERDQILAEIEVGMTAEEMLEMLQAQVVDLQLRDPPILGQVRPIADGYLVSVPLRDHKGDVLLLRVSYDRSRPHQAPQLAVRLNDQLLDYRPALLDDWRPGYTLSDLIDAVIEDQP